MSLLLTRHVHQYCVDVRQGFRGGLRPHCLHPAALEPFANQLTVKTIMLDHQHALHGEAPP